MATGATAALVLTLGVFAGAPESVITGSVLVAFALGWVLLLALSSRRTAQPQRWAAVPAVAMGASGSALIVFEPADAALTTISWVWPVAVLTLIWWMVAGMRRDDLSKGGRRLLTPVIAVLALASVGAMYENVAVVRDHHDFSAPGKMFEVDGHRLHLDCHGNGGPTVVLFNGLGEVSASWARITPDLARVGRVCAYDRAGQGWSEDAKHPQDGVTAARDLNELLDKAGERGPFVVVGHSIGGTYAMTFAARYPEKVAGMALLDSSSPEQFSRMPDYPRQYAAIRRAYALMPTLYRLAVGQASAAAVPSHLPAEAADRVRAVTANAHGARSMRDDASMLHQVFDQAQALTTLGDQPLAVLTATGSLKDTDGWAAAQAQMSALSGNSVHEVVESSHLGLLEDRNPAAAASRAIIDVVSSARSGSPVLSR